MKKFKVYVARKIPKAGIDMLKKVGFSVEVNPNPERVLPKRELIKKLKGKDAVLTLLTDKIDDEVLKSCPSIKVVANYAVGFDNIDIKSATNNKVVVTNTPEVLTEAVAEHTFALMLAVGRRIAEADRFTRAGKYKVWMPELFLGQSLEGKTLGVIGLGRIGSSVARRAALGMNMKVLYHTRRRNPKFEKKYGAKAVSIDGLLKKSDVVSIHVPLTKKTRHMISKKQLSMMKPTAILINTARGPIIEEKYLINALKKKQIAGAGLDVFECEPEITCQVHPIELRDLPNTVLTPHIASATHEARNQMAILSAQAIVSVAKNKMPQNIVNKEVWKSRK